MIWRKKIKNTLKKSLEYRFSKLNHAHFRYFDFLRKILKRKTINQNKCFLNGPGIYKSSIQNSSLVLESGLQTHNTNCFLLFIIYVVLGNGIQGLKNVTNKPQPQHFWTYLNSQQYHKTSVFPSAYSNQLIQKKGFLKSFKKKEKRKKPCRMKDSLCSEQTAKRERRHCKRYETRADNQAGFN